MAYQLLETNMLQSAIKAASAITAASIQAGNEDAQADPVGFMDEISQHFFEQLTESAKKENEMLRKEAETQPQRRSGGGGQRGGGGFGKAPSDGTMKLSWGAFNGKSIAEVYEMTPSEASDYAASQGKSYDKSGATYVEWLSKNDKNKYAADRAKAFLDAKKS